MRAMRLRRPARRPETPSASVRVRPVRSSLPAAVEGALAGPGKPLDVAVRAEMERRFGHDFGDVSVHADTHAAAAARLLDADAFTSGADIVFGEGRYRPDDEDGRRLIAHELAHTLQQGRSAATSLQTSAPETDPLEREAAAVAARVVAGEALAPGAVTVAAPAARGRIARQARAAIERLPAEVPDSPEAVRALADDIARLLAFDPADDAGRVRRRLARFASTTREAVATELAGRIPATTAAQLRQILSDLLPAGTKPVAAEPGATPSEAETAQAIAPDVADTATAESDEALEPSAATLVDTVGTAASEVVPEPMAVPEGPAVEPVLAAEVAPSGPEGLPVSPAEPEPEPERRAAGAAPGRPQPMASAGGPEEDAIDEAPVDDTESEALLADDEADAEPVDAGDEEVARGVAAAPVAADQEPEPATDEPAEEEAPDLIAEESGDGDDPGGPVADPDSPVPAAPAAEPEEPEEEELVADKPPEQPEPGAEEPEGAPADAPAALADRGPAAELEIAEPTPEGDAEATEPEESSDLELTDEEPEAGEQAAAGPAGEEAAAPIEEPSEPGTPDLSGADPADAMEAAGHISPARSEVALAGVEAASSRSVAAQREALADAPPELDRPTGAPTVEELAAESAAAEAAVAPARLQRAPEPPTAVATRVQPLAPAPPPVAAGARAPQIAGGPQGELDDDGRRALRASLRALPVHDPALDVSPGPAPAVPLEGASDPQRAHAERDKLETAGRAALTEGRRQIVEPAGEQQLVPRVPDERLTAAMPATSAAAAPPAAAQATPATDPASVLAREKRGDELRAAAKDAAAGMRTKRAEQATTAAEERRRSQEQVTQAVRDSAAQHSAARAEVRGAVHDQRKQWSVAEHDLAEGELTKADARLSFAVEDVTKIKTDADQKAAAHIEAGERDAETARREGEERAAAERKRGEEKTSDGVLGWLADKATAFFDEIKAGITKAFEAARAAVRAAIEGAKKLAAAAIDLARSAIVTAIRLAGDALIAIGDRLLAGFPGVRDRFRRAIDERVKQAQKAVNALAEDLKNAVQKALDLLGAALDAALGLLEKGLLAMVDVYRAAVAGALKWAQSVVNAFAAFAALMEDVAANPRQWLANLAASAKDGVRNHLWKAFKVAIKRWFSDKVEEVLGLGPTIWNLLRKGGVSLARIGSMVWNAIKAAIPPALVQILVEKLISLLIPAAAAVMLIIETLQAAWGTIQRVLEAFERFFAFLKAVRTGRAGPLFANAIASAAIAVIDFVANWLLKRLRKPAGKIAKKLKALAKKLGTRFAKAGRGLLKKRRKKPKLKGKPKKKPKPDKKAQADKRVAAATDFVVKQLARGLWEPVLWLQLKYARLRWRVHIRFRARDDTGEMTISGSPAKKKKVKDKRRKKRPAYSAAIRRYQGFLRAYHHRHHLLSSGVKEWWEAADLNWNDPIYFLDIPAMLHLRSLHRSLGKLDAAKAKTVSRAFRRKLRDQWNSYWQVWLDARLPKWVTVNPSRKELAKAVREPGSSLRARVQREITVTGINELLAEFSARSGVPLRKYRVKGYSMQKHFEYLAQLSELEDQLKKAKKKDHDNVIRAWQLRILGGIKKLSKAQRKWWPS